MATTAYKHVQAGPVNTTLTTTTSRAVVFTSAVVAGNAVVGWIWIADASGSRVTSPAASDNLSQTYQTLLLPVASGGSFLFFWFLNSAAGTPTVTVSWTSTKTTSVMVVHEFSGIPSNFVIDVTTSVHKTSGTNCTPATVTTTHNNAFLFGALWNSGANSLTNPPTATPASTNAIVQSSGLVSNSLYADSWLQQAIPVATGMGFTVSSSTEVTDVGNFSLSANQSPYVQSSSGQAGGNTASTLSMSGIGAGHCMLACVTYLLPSGTQPIVSLSDVHNNTWVEAANAFDATLKLGISVQYCLSPITGGGSSLIVTGSVAASCTQINVSLIETNQIGMLLVDGFNSHDNAALVSSLTAGSFTPAQNGDLIFYGVASTTSMTGSNTFSDTGLFCADLFVQSAGFSAADGLMLQTTAAAINPAFGFASARKGVAAAFALTSIGPGVVSNNRLSMMGCGT